MRQQRPNHACKRRPNQIKNSCIPLNSSEEFPRKTINSSECEKVFLYLFKTIYQLIKVFTKTIALNIILMGEGQYLKQK